MRTLLGLPLNRIPTLLAAALLLVGVRLAPLAAQTNYIERGVGAGDSPSTFISADRLLFVTELETDPDSPLRAQSTNGGAGYSIGREGAALVKRRTSLADGVEMSVSASVLASATDATAIPATTTTGQTPLARAYVLVQRERIDVVAPIPGAATARLRINAEFSVIGNGIRSENRVWSPTGSASLLISGTIYRRSGNQRISDFSTAFAIEQAVSADGPTASVGRIFGQGNLGTTFTPDYPGVGVAGGSGAWNSLSNGSGTGYIDLNVPNGSYVEFTVTCEVRSEVRNVSSPQQLSGIALATYQMGATGRVWATTPEGGLATARLGTALRSQNINVGVADRALTSPAFDLPAVNFFEQPLTYTLLRGPASLSGLTITPNGTRGLVELRATQPGGNDFIPAASDLSFRLIGLSQTLDFPALANRPANSPAFIPPATASSGLPVTFTITSGPATTDGQTVTLTGQPGTVRVVGRQLGDDIYEPTAAIERTFGVTPITLTPQSINFPSLLNTEVGAGQLVLVTANSGLPVTLTITAGSATFGGINNNILTATAPGLVTVRATQPGGVNNGVTYAAATPVSRSFTATAAITPLESFLTAAGVPAGQRGPTADPDGDDIPNLLEYALGGDPMSRASAPSPFIQISGLSPQPSFLTLTYVRAVPEAVTYVVETTTDLTAPDSWTSVGVAQGTPAPDGLTTASIALDGPRRFLRLRVTLVAP